MNDKAKELRREYKRKWNANNKDKVKAAQERYWERKAAERERTDLYERFPGKQQGAD